MMANEATRLSTIIDTLWDKSVPTIKKTEGGDAMVKHLMGAQYTPQAFSSLNNDQKAEIIITAVKKVMMNMVESGGQIETKATLEQQVIDGGTAAKTAFDPDL